jgi:hypothetical protein
VRRIAADHRDLVLMKFIFDTTKFSKSQKKILEKRSKLQTFDDNAIDCHLHPEGEAQRVTSDLFKKLSSSKYSRIELKQHRRCENQPLSLGTTANLTSSSNLALALLPSHLQLWG